MNSIAENLTSKETLEVRSAMQFRKVKPAKHVRNYNFKEAVKALLGKQNVTSLNVEQMKEAATKIVPFNDFGDQNEGGLQALVASLNTDISLHAFGKREIQTQIVTKLCWRLGIEGIFRKFPQINDRKITSPVFIIGLPRSGTTLLHALMARDKNHRWMPAWEAGKPLPRPGYNDRASDPRLLEAKKHQEWLRRENPENLKMHHVAYDEPEECTTILKSSFVSGIWWWLTGAHGYLAWLADQSYEDVYRLHLRYLKVMDSMKSAPRWLLKSPSHLAHVDVIKKIYPDAKFIHIHRDPMKSLASGASLTSAIRKKYVDKIQLSAAGYEVAHANTSAINRYMKQRDHIPDADIVDVYFHELMSDPKALVEKIYQHFGFKFDEEINNRIDKYLVENPRNKHGTHEYSLAQFALFEGREREKYRDYMDRFNIPFEKS